MSTLRGLDREELANDKKAVNTWFLCCGRLQMLFSSLFPQWWSLTLKCQFMARMEYGLTCNL